MSPLPRPAGSLAEAFAAAMPRGAGAPPEDLEASLRALFEAGRAAWPAVPLEAEALADHLGTHFGSVPVLPPESLAADVYLACACAAGAVGAAAAFDVGFSSTLTAAIARIDGAPAFVADARQTILEHLLVAPPGVRPRIAEYGGRAPLRAWLRAVALRVALNLKRGKAEAPHEPIADDGPEAAASTDPELGYLKARYKPEIEAAVRAAVGRLTAKEREFLRLHLVDAQSIDALGAHYGVGQSTAARWLASARTALREHTRAELEGRLGLTGSGMDSLVGLVWSRLEVSAQSLLAEGDG